MKFNVANKVFLNQLFKNKTTTIFFYFFLHY